MSTSIAAESDTSLIDANDRPSTAHLGNPDPITGEPGAHPVGVGVGALSAGAAGAAIGSIGGPVGMIIGAAIGAVAGGLAGKEVAASEALDSTSEPESPAPQENMVGSDSRARGVAAGDPQTVPVTMLPLISEEEIRVAAYHVFIERTRAGAPGDELDDWLRAERESRGR